MTVTAALWTQTGSFTAQQDRQLIDALVSVHGVVSAGDLEVTPGAGHSVNVAAGRAFVRGSQTADQGTYLIGNDATLNVPIATPDATNPRVDIIQIRVTDDSAGAGVSVIDAKSGVPAGSPVAPTADPNSLVLATVLVPASATSSANYTITDRRILAGGAQVYPRVYQQPVSGGPTSGTTELVVATLVVPAQPIDTIQVPSATVSLSATTAGEQFSLRIRETNTSGTALGQQRDATASVSGGGVVASMTIADGLARSVPAGNAATYVCTIARITGSGTASVLVSPNTMSVLVLPDRS